MIAFTKTETVYFNNRDELTDYVNSLQSSENMDQGTATGIKMNGYASKNTAVAQRPAVETYVTAELPQLQFVGS